MGTNNRSTKFKFVSATKLPKLFELRLTLLAANNQPQITHIYKYIYNGNYIKLIFSRCLFQSCIICIIRRRNTPNLRVSGGPVGDWEVTVIKLKLILIPLTSKITNKINNRTSASVKLVQCAEVYACCSHEECNKGSQFAAVPEEESGGFLNQTLVLPSPPPPHA